MTYIKDSLTHSLLEYQIGDDVIINVISDCGIVNPVFYLTLHYKGISVLPYSLFVEYFYADSEDIANYLRRYEADFSSWVYAFDFIEIVIKKVKADGNSFVEDMLRNEVNKMIKGLRLIATNPMGYLNRMAGCKNAEIESHYYSVRQMTVDEKMAFRNYPHEMMRVFMAEKITGVLEFVEGIKELAQIDPCFDRAVDEIVFFARKLYPALEQSISSLDGEMENSADRWQKLIFLARLKECKERLDSYSSIINIEP